MTKANCVQTQTHLVLQELEFPRPWALPAPLPINTVGLLPSLPSPQLASSFGYLFCQAKARLSMLKWPSRRPPVTPVQSKQCPAATWDWLGRDRAAACHRPRLSPASHTFPGYHFLWQSRFPAPVDFRKVIVQRTGVSQEARACPASARHVTSDKLTCQLWNPIISCFKNTAKENTGWQPFVPPQLLPK